MAITLLLAVFLTVHASLLSAQPAAPQLTQPVNDFANVIDAESEREIDRRVRALEQATGDVVAVATVPTFRPYGTIDEYALKQIASVEASIQEGLNLVMDALREASANLEQAKRHIGQ